MKTLTTLALTAALFCLGCNNETQTSGNKAATNPTQEVPTTTGKEAQHTPNIAPAEHKPHYVTAQQGEYAYKGYGNDQSELMLVRYLGEENGSYRVKVNSDKEARFELTCEADCHIIHMKNFMGSQFLIEETITDPKSIQYLIMQDARAGLLTTYKE